MLDFGFSAGFTIWRTTDATADMNAVADFPKRNLRHTAIRHFAMN
jgi:hypothetical protein